MRILHLIDKLNFGGAQVLLKGIFEKEDKDLFLISLQKVEEEVEIKSRKVTSLESKLNTLQILSKIRSFCEKNNVEVLHCHLFKSQIVGFFLKCFYLKKIKLIFHEHGRIFGSEKNSLIEHLLYKSFVFLAQPRVNKFIAISNATKEKLLKNSVPEHKIKVLYNYVGEKFFFSKKKENRGKFNVGFAARFIERKGWKDFLDAASLLVKRNDNFYFFMAGDGRDKGKIIKYIDEKNLKERVSLLGYVADMPNFYFSLDCFVVTSHWEPFGITVLEAQAAKTPVIATNIEGLNEVIHDNEDSIFVNKKDPADLADKIEMLAKNRNKMTQLRKKGTANAKRYNLENYLKNQRFVYS